MTKDRNSTVVIFSHAYFPYIGGAETAIKGITDEIGDFNFVMLTARMRRDIAPSEKNGNVLVYRIGFGIQFDKFLLPIFAFFKFLSLRKNLPRSIIFWGMMASYGSIAAYFLKIFYPKIPFLLTLQEGDSERHIYRARFGLVGFFWKRLIRRADKIQVISFYLRDLALSFGAKGTIEIIPNGVDFEKFSKPDRQKTLILQQKLGIKPDEKIIVTVSRLVEKNAVDVVIQSLLFINTPIRLVVLGEGEEKEKLLRLIRELKIEDRVIFPPSDISFEEVPSYLSLGHIFIRPSRSEGLGTAFLEAMAAGVPIIATSVGGIKDFLRDGETGLEVKVDDPKDLAEKINRLLTDETLRQKLIANGRKLVKEKYQWSIIARDMDRIFRSMP